MKKSMMMSWLGRMMPFQLCKRLRAFRNLIGISYNKLSFTTEKPETEKKPIFYLLGRFCDYRKECDAQRST